MLDFDEGCKRCDCNSGIVVDHVTKSISCSQCGHISEAKAGSFHDLLLFTFRNPLNLGSVPHPFIADLSDRLGLPETIKIYADAIYKTVDYPTNRKNWDAFYSACIYIACRQEQDMTRSLSEISFVVDGVTSSDISKAVGIIAEQLSIDKNPLMNYKPSDFIKRFCSALKMDNIAVKAAQEAAKSVNSTTRSAKSVAAAIVYYIVTRLSSNNKIRFKDVREATGVDEKTLAQTYKGLVPHLSRIVTAREQEKLVGSH